MSDFDNITANNGSNKEKINFYLPGFSENLALYAMFEDFHEHIPSWFYDDFKIAAVYGCFPNMIWNGGRAYFGKVGRPSMKQAVEEMNKRGIAIRYTFTNPLLEEKHMGDTLCNIALEVADNGMNEVLVNTACIEEHVRKNYPSFKIISSTTKCLRTIDLVEKELDKDYYLVVLDSALNVDERIFNIAKRDRLELLVDHGCQLNCPNRERHYIASGKAQLTFDNVDFPGCPFTINDFEGLKKKEHFISREMINNKFAPGGFKHFKLDGRVFQKEKLVDSMLYYMVLPEHQERMKEIIKKEVYGNANVW